MEEKKPRRKPSVQKPQHYLEASSKKERREVRRADRQRKREEAQKWIQEYLAQHPCVDCGEPDPVVLTFDHVRGEKRGTILELILEGANRKDVEWEIKKCQVRCRNCHHKRHKRIGRQHVNQAWVYPTLEQDE